MVYRSRGERWCVSLGAGALPVTPPGPASPSPCDPHPSPGPGPQDLTPALTDRALVVGPSGRRRPGCVQVTPAWLTWSGAEAALDGGSAVEKSGVHSAGRGTTERFHQGMVGWSGPEEESPRLWRRDSGGVSRKRRSLSICGKRDDCSLTTRGQRPQEGWGRRQTENSGGGTQSGLWKRKRRDRRMRSEEKEEEGEKRGGDDSAVENSDALVEMERRGGSDAWRSSLLGL